MSLRLFSREWRPFPPPVAYTCQGEWQSRIWPGHFPQQETHFDGRFPLLRLGDSIGRRPVPRNLAISLGTSDVAFFSNQFPDIALHVVSSDDPQGIVMNEYSRGMPDPPRRIWQGIPIFAVRRMPDIISIS